MTTSDEKKIQIVFRGSSVQELREKIRKCVDYAADNSVDGLSTLADEVENLSSNARDIVDHASRSKNHIDDAMQEAEEVESSAANLETDIDDIASSIRGYVPDNSDLVNELTAKITSMFSAEYESRIDRTDADTSVFSTISAMVVRIRELRDQITEITDDMLVTIDDRNSENASNNYAINYKTTKTLEEVFSDSEESR